MTTTIPVDQLGEGFRAFATEWMGFDPWIFGGVDRAGPGAWIGHVLPLTTPAGFALGVAWLAHRLGNKNPAGLWFYYSEYSEEYGWTLTVGDIRGQMHHHRLELADIPEACPTCGDAKCIYRGALAGCHSTSCPKHDCPDCRGTGRNPHRAAQALRACLLATS